jgi:hypothetical protein
MKKSAGFTRILLRADWLAAFIGCGNFQECSGRVYRPARGKFDLQVSSASVSPLAGCDLLSECGKKKKGNGSSQRLSILPTS